MYWKDKEVDPEMLSGEGAARLVKRLASEADPVVAVCLRLALLIASRKGAAYASGVHASAYFLVSRDGDFASAIAEVRREMETKGLRADFLAGARDGLAVLEGRAAKAAPAV